MTEALRVLVACRKTAVTINRVALKMIHWTLLAAPDSLRDQLRTMMRIQLVQTFPAWRPDLTDYREVEFAHRIGLKSLDQRCLEL